MLDAKTIAASLDDALRSPNPVAAWHMLTESWSADPDARAAVRPILELMEQNPDVDYGCPGPLTHFIEDFHRDGYEVELVASVGRRPTPHTVWLLRRLINGTKDEGELAIYVELMVAIGNHPTAPEKARRAAQEFVDEFSG
jgi:hypothetical protein